MIILGDHTLRRPCTYNQIRDVAVTSVTVGDGCYGSTEVYPSRDVIIKVTLRNEAVFVEAVNITVYYDDNIIQKQAVNLFSTADRTLIFNRNPTCVPYGNYTINAYVAPVPGETYRMDNTLINGQVKVRLWGDVNGDGKVTATHMAVLKSVLTKIMLGL